MVAKVPISQTEHQSVAQRIELLSRSFLWNTGAATTGLAKGRYRNRRRTPVKVEFGALVKSTWNLKRPSEVVLSSSR